MINQFKEYERNEMQNESRIRNKKREYIYKKNEKKIDQKIKSYIVIISDVMLSLLCICILYFLRYNLYFLRYKQFDLYSFLISYIYMYLEVKSCTCMYMYFLTSKH